MSFSESRFLATNWLAEVVESPEAGARPDGTMAAGSGSGDERLLHRDRDRQGGSALDRPPDRRGEVDLLQRPVRDRDRGLLFGAAGVLAGLPVAGVGDAGPELAGGTVPAGFDPDLADSAVRAAGGSVVARHGPRSTAVRGRSSTERRREIAENLRRHPGRIEDSTCGSDEDKDPRS